MQRLRRIVHRRRSSNGDNSLDLPGTTLAVPASQLQVLASDQGIAPQKSGTLLKYTNVLKGWKRRAFTLENGVLVYSTPHGETENDTDRTSNAYREKERRKKRKHIKKRILRRTGSKDEKERDIRGSINLQFAVVSPDESDDTRFAIDVGNDVFHCKAESREERDSWVHALSGSQQYFRNLIQKAISRAKENKDSAERVQDLASPDTARKQDVTPLDVMKSASGTPMSEESDESFLEDDGLREAEESRKALSAELRRVLTFWRMHWVHTDMMSPKEEDILTVLAETFRDCKTNSETADASTREAANGLIALVAWCLHVLQTNDEMFERRLKADVTRMMGGVLPVFPTSPEFRSRLPSQESRYDDDDDSEDEFLDALSRAASIRSSHARMGIWKEERELFSEVPEEISVEDRPYAKVDGQITMQRVATSVISRTYKGARVRLPPLSASREKLNVFNLLKDCVGKDLSKISMPVTLNEPLSFLQRLAEDIEYSELLDQGARESDPDRRMMYVAAMIISHLSSTQGRISKPFNPLLGETFGLVRPDKGNGIRFIAEQVSHHPPISACYAEGSGASWKYYSNIEIRNKFWGKSLEVFPTGLNHIEFPEYGDHYVFDQITSCVHNIVVGRMWLDNYGEMEIVNRTTGGRCTINFNKTGWMSDAKSFGSLKGTVYDHKGQAKIRIGGNWTRCVYEELPKGKKNILWTVDGRPSEEASQAYNMTKWAITLNSEVRDEEFPFVAPTDSRIRPDQRALENGKYELAQELKLTLEEGQRKRRKELEDAGENWSPAWFEQTTDEVTGRIDFKYKGHYFEKKSAGDWSQSCDLFSSASSVQV